MRSRPLKLQKGVIQIGLRSSTGPDVSTRPCLHDYPYGLPRVFIRPLAFPSVGALLWEQRLAELEATVVRRSTE
jgi:hypothetical protein